ncbi:precorrin-3B synthase [Sulfitobacter sp. SK012]|uniref:precorrin-3B synthase n=1 Tax=Sulfitobacter sp. SK012 TaxID=1389005 RepID=UPI000E0A8A15|nr:precorrin-3B synthase [Sulfitobacter sp. SK012]AXI44808.1 precorrin-3B synthase [Sulfitobacter sp. SK012]
MTCQPQIKGWCPGALRPMLSGDGWVVRVRPFSGRLGQAQADGLATLATAHGNGVIDLSSRGNIQLRGVRLESLDPLRDGLRHLSLLDPDAETESRRNVLVTPFWEVGDQTELFAAELTKALAPKDAPELPGKFGFAIDTGRLPVLQGGSADIRLECDAAGGFILVADGAKTGKSVTVATAVPEALALAKWFAEIRGTNKRMATCIDAGLGLPAGHVVPRQTQNFDPKPGHSLQGSLVGLAFGQMKAETLATLAKHGALRMTPWRLMLVEGAQTLPDIDGVITDPADPLLRVAACIGAPGCPQALGTTRDLVRALAAHVELGEILHISGCAKGCAHPRAASITVIATAEGYALTRNGTAAGEPDHNDLTIQTLIKAI